MLTVELATLRTRGAYWYNCEWNVEESNIKAAMEKLSAKRDSSGVLQRTNRTASVSEIEKHWLFL